MADAISPELLRRRLSEDGMTIIDTRNPEDFESWHIPGATNYPFSPGDEVDFDHLEEQIESEDDIATICAKGISSYEFADRLDDGGYPNVQVVQDGMEGWSRVYEVAAIPTAATAVEIFQIQRVAKGCLGYVIGSPTVGEAVVVDPTRHIDEYRRVAEDDGMTITRVIDTHVHADHISGGRDLADAVDATYHLPAAAADRGVDYDFAPLERNEVITIGDVELKAIHTPGHTGDIMSILVGADAVLTGDTVFLDGVGRTELQFGEEGAAAGAEMLYESIHGSILNLPDGISVLPGHAAIEDEETLASIGDPMRTSVGQLRMELPILQEDKETFVARVGGAETEKPPNYERMMAINTGEARIDDESDAAELELGPNRCAAAAD